MGILLVVLGANVTRHRAIRGDTGNQMPTDPADRMFIAQRAHGNASEYIPTLAVLIVVCAVLTDGWWLNALAIAALSARLLHAVGMLTSKTLASHGPMRDIGATATYVSGLALGVTAIAVGDLHAVRALGPDEQQADLDRRGGVGRTRVRRDGHRRVADRQRVGGAGRRAERGQQEDEGEEATHPTQVRKAGGWTQAVRRNPRRRTPGWRPPVRAPGGPPRSRRPARR